MTTKAMIIWASVGIIGLGIGMRFGSNPNPATPAPTPVPPASRARHNLTPPAPMINVQISGEVVSPGIFQVKKGTRISEVIAMAGGLNSSADDSKINYVGKVRDGQHIKIPTLKFKSARVKNSPQHNPAPANFDINRASKSELMARYDISGKTASAIIQYRREMGWIRDSAELSALPNIPTTDRNRLMR